MQILLFIGIAAASMTIISVIGTLLIPPITGLSLREMTDPDSWKVGDQRVVAMLRIMMLIQFLGLFVIPSLVFAYLNDRRPSRYLGLRRPWTPAYWIIGLSILLVAIPVVELAGQLNRQIPFDAGTLKWITDMEDKAGQTLKLLLGGTSVSELILNIIFIAVFAAVGEELVFRGVLQRIFIRGFRSPWAGIIFTAFLFSFFHMQFFGFIPRFFLGILLGALYWYSGSLWTAILAHFVYDAFFITLAWYYPKLVNDPEATVVDPSARIIVGLISAVLVAALLWLMKKNSVTRFKDIYAGDNPPDENDHRPNHGIQP
jgi:uncharacterized protein